MNSVDRRKFADFVLLGADYLFKKDTTVTLYHAMDKPSYRKMLRELTDEEIDDYTPDIVVRLIARKYWYKIYDETREFLKLPAYPIAQLQKRGATGIDLRGLLAKKKTQEQTKGSQTTSKTEETPSFSEEEPLREEPEDKGGSQKQQGEEQPIYKKTLFQELGVSEDASLEEVRRTYQTKAKQLHPDYLAANTNLTEEQRDKAQEELKELNALYDFWKRQQRETKVPKEEVQEQKAAEQRPPSGEGAFYPAVIRPTEVTEKEAGPKSPRDKPDLYKILGIPKNASRSKIERAYRLKRLAHQAEDFTGIVEEERLELEKELSRLNQAFETLSNPDRKSAYDQFLAQISIGPGTSSGITTEIRPTTEIKLPPEVAIPETSLSKAFAQKGIGMALKKGASVVATKLGLKAASQVIAGVIAPGVGNVIAFLSFVISELLSKIKRFLGKLLKDPQSLLGPIVFTGLFFGGLVVGGVVGTISAGIGALGGLGYLSASGKGASLVNQSIGIGQVIATGVITATTTISIPFIVALVALPIIVALILFIINSGAYIVPPSPGFDQIPGAINPGIVASGSCPLTGPAIISEGSFDGINDRGHGSNRYWVAVGNACNFPIPLTIMNGCFGPDPRVVGSAASVCGSAEPRCVSYGFATDVQPTSPLNNFPPVVLPSLCDPGSIVCPPLNWEFEQKFYICRGGGGQRDSCPAGNRWGYGAIFTSSGNGHSWRIYLAHIDPLDSLVPNQTYQSNTVVGNITRDLAPSSHLHIELSVDSAAVRPDFLCGGESTEVPGTQVSGWVVTAPLDANNLVASSTDEFGQKSCEWASSKGINYAVNANYWNTPTEPVGPAGIDGKIKNFASTTGTPTWSLVVNKQKRVFITRSSQVGKYEDILLVVSGVPLLLKDGLVQSPFHSSVEDVRPRTAIGIGGNKLYLLLLKAATTTQTATVMKSLGATDALLLDSGSSSTLCSGNQTIFGNTKVVVNSIGVRSGIIRKLNP